MFPGGRALAWLTCLKVDFAAIPSQTAKTGTGTERGSLAGRWRAMTRNSKKMIVLGSQEC